MSRKKLREGRFRKIGFLTVGAIYFLILVGGIVRGTGSGMGCPDWPKCFGSWIPPTHINQLPADYQEVYKEKRVEKNQRVARLLGSLGFEKTAAEIFAHPLSFLETEFNVTKTWIEYLNRLVGVAVGILIFLTLLYSFSYWNSDRSIPLLTLFSFFLVGFQGWLGSLVVSTNLLPVMVTLHMGLAIVLVGVLQYAIARSQARKLAYRVLPKTRLLYGLLLAALALSFVQVVLGTQVREQIDLVAFELNNQLRETWVDRLGLSFYIHRSFSLLLLGVNLYLALFVFRLKDSFLRQQALGILALVGAGILTGLGMAYFAVPAFLQPLHLFFATLLFGVQMMLFLTYYYATCQPVAAPVAVYSKV